MGKRSGFILMVLWFLAGGFSLSARARGNRDGAEPYVYVEPVGGAILLGASAAVAVRTLLMARSPIRIQCSLALQALNRITPNDPFRGFFDSHGRFSDSGRLRLVASDPKTFDPRSPSGGHEKKPFLLEVAHEGFPIYDPYYYILGRVGKGSGFFTSFEEPTFFVNDDSGKHLVSATLFERGGKIFASYNVMTKIPVSRDTGGGLGISHTLFEAPKKKVTLAETEIGSLGPDGTVHLNENYAVAITPRVQKPPDRALYGLDYGLPVLSIIPRHRREGGK